MRKVLAAALSLIAVSVTGCDINTTPKTTQVGCNCAQPPAPPAGMRGSDTFPPPAGTRTHERYRSHGGPHRGYARWSGHWRTDLPEQVYFDLIPRAAEFEHP